MKSGLHLSNPFYPKEKYSYNYIIKKEFLWKNLTKLNKQLS